MIIVSENIIENKNNEIVTKSKNLISSVINDIGDYGYCKYLRPVNAENFIQ